MCSYSDLNLQAQLICLSTQINGNIGTITQKLTKTIDHGIIFLLPENVLANQSKANSLYLFQGVRLQFIAKSVDETINKGILFNN